MPNRGRSGVGRREGEVMYATPPPPSQYTANANDRAAPTPRELIRHTAYVILALACVVSG
jgi:hypothetical protein